MSQPSEPGPIGATDDAFLVELMREHAVMRRELPHIDPDELLNILYAVLKPFGSGRRFLLRKAAGGHFVF